MNFQAHEKSYSESELPNQLYPLQPIDTQSNKPFPDSLFLGTSTPQHACPNVPTSKTNLTNSHLQFLKNRFLRGLQKYQDTKTPQNHATSKDLSGIKVDRIFNSTNNSNGRGVFNIPYAIRLQKDKKDVQIVHNFFYSAKHREGSQSLERSADETDEKCSEFNDEQFRKTNSLMIIRKLQRKKARKEEGHQQKKDSQLNKTREIPIHHTHYYFSKVNRNKSEGSTPAESKIINQKTNRAIKEILKLQQALRQQEDRNSFRAAYEERSMPPKRFSHEITVQKLTSSKEAKLKLLRNHRRGISIEKRGGIRREEKQEESDLGPWNRKATGDYDDFIQSISS